MSLWEAKSGFTEHVRYLNVAPIMIFFNFILPKMLKYWQDFVF